MILLLQVCWMCPASSSLQRPPCSFIQLYLNVFCCEAESNRSLLTHPAVTEQHGFILNRVFGHLMNIALVFLMYISFIGLYKLAREIVAGEHNGTLSKLLSKWDCLLFGADKAINMPFLRAFVMLCKKHNHVFMLTERERNAGISGFGYTLPIQG